MKWKSKKIELMKGIKDRKMKKFEIGKICIKYSKKYIYKKAVVYVVQVAAHSIHNFYGPC